MPDLKEQVRSFWEAEPCGTRYGVGDDRTEYLEEIARARYAIEPYILDFARFGEAQGQRVLEMGVGAGSDYVNWLRAGAHAVGIDLTLAAARLSMENAARRGRGATGRVVVADAESLPLPSDHFDLVYSWGVLHHSPDTRTAFREAFRVLRPGGTLRAMVYHVPSWSGWMLWVQHALLKGRPGRSVDDVLAHHLESPGTKAYSVEGFRSLLTDVGVTDLEIRTHLSTSDLLLQERSGRYQSGIFRLVWALYPRWLVRSLGHRYGMVLMAEGRKPGGDRQA